jgi:hypothetical protein
MAGEQDDIVRLTAKLAAQRDQQIEDAVQWLRNQSRLAPPQGVRPGHVALNDHEVIALAVSHWPLEKMLALPRGHLLIVQRLAWLGLSDVLNLYTKRREEEKWA